MTNRMFDLLCTAFGLAILSGPTGVFAKPSTRIHIRTDRSTALMGSSVVVTAAVTGPGGLASPGQELQPFLNGREWGAPARTDATGRASLIIPLPNTAVVAIQAAIENAEPVQKAEWIWARKTSDGQIVDFARSFNLQRVPSNAVLRITCDDAFRAFLNGHPAAAGSDFHQVRVVSDLRQWLRKGRNVLAVEGRNGTGPAGLLAALVMTSNVAERAIDTDSSWKVYDTTPSGWPTAPRGAGEAATAIARSGEGVWGYSIIGWPGISPHSDFPVGLPLRPHSIVSNTVHVRVAPRVFHVKRDPAHRVGMEWEPWFTPLNARWDTAEAVPLVGKYDSFNTDVIRQHCLWMADAGVDFLLVDWSNNLWDKKHWSERAPGVNDLIRATTEMLDTYADLKKEGVPVPQVTLLLGLDNGPSTTPQAIDEEMQWVFKHFVANPRYAGLWLYDDGKPLIVPFDGGGQAAEVKLSLDPRFTVRWMASQLDGSHLERKGYWSWMDGVIHPVPTLRDGKVEALTVTPAFFSDGGWTYPRARGRRGGATYVEEFTTALADRPQYLLINQWNEFAGQPIGGGYGPKHDQYVDTYNIPLSDDIEPVSLTACGYRGCGGWGFYYLNLTHALLDLYRSPGGGATVLAVADPERGAVVHGGILNVDWSSAGAVPAGYTLKIDGRTAVTGVHPSHASLDIRSLTRGWHTVTLLAEGAVQRFPLSYTQEDGLIPRPQPAAVNVRFLRE